MISYPSRIDRSPGVNLCLPEAGADMATPSEPPPRSTRHAILDAAEAAFAERGFHQTKLRNVAAEVGVTQPLIHHYFGSKDALFEAVLTRVVLEYDAAQAQQWKRAPNDVRFFIDGISVLSEFIGRHRATARLMGWARLEGRLPKLPEGAAVNAKVRQRFVAAKEASALCPELDVDVARLLVDGVIRGFWARADDDPVLRAHAPGITRALIDAMLPSLLTDAALKNARALLAAQERP